MSDQARDDNIRLLRHAYEERLNSLRWRHVIEVEPIVKKLARLRDICPHSCVVHHSDPAGDSGFYECNVCGSTMPRFISTAPANEKGGGA